MTAKLHLNGSSIKSEDDLHDAIEKQLQPSVYGRNLDALDEVLAEMVEPPIEILWTNAAKSQSVLGSRFGKFVEVFRDAEAEYQPGQYRFDLRMD
jgi:RNAse (barnase) inhibitor barstar